MPGPNSIEFTFTARDLASPVVEKLRNELKLFGPSGEVLLDLARRTETATTNLDTSVVKVTRSLRGLTVPLLSEVAPAFGTTATQITQVVASSAALASGWGALAIAGAGLAGIIGGQLVGAWQRHREALDDFNRAQRSIDVDLMTRGLQREREEVSRLTDELIDLREELARLRGVQGQIPLGEFNPGSVGPTGNPARERDLEERIRRLQQRATRLQGFVASQTTSDLLRAEGEDFERQDSATGLGASEARRRLRDIRGQIAEVAILDPIERAFAAAIRQAEGDRTLGAEGALIAQELRRLAQATRGQALQIELERARVAAQAAAEAPFAADVGAGGPLTAADVAAARAFQRSAFEADLRARFGAQAAAEAPFAADVGAGGPLTAEQAAAGRQVPRDAAAVQAQLLDIARQRLEVEGQVAGLTLTERENLEIRLSLQREHLGLRQLEQQILAAATPEEVKVLEARKALVQVEEERRRLLIEQAQLERVDPAAGLAAGFRDVAETVESAGARMREGVVRSFHDINRGFADIVVAGITGQTGKFAEIGRRLGEAMLRSLVEQFTTRITGAIFRGVDAFLSPGGIVRSAVGAVGVAGSLVAPAGVGAGTPVSFPGGGAGIVTATGTVQPVASTGGALAYGSGGNAVGGGGVNVPISGVSQLFSGGGGGGGFASGFFGPSVSLYEAAIAYQAAGLQGVAALQTGQAVISGGQYVATVELAAFGGYEAAGASLGAAQGATGTASSAAGAGATAAAALGFIGGVAGAAFSAYSAYQAGAAGDKYAALSGALTTAAFGAIAGLAVGGPIGAAVGAVVGAAVGAGAGAAGKASQKKSHEAREAKEFQRIQQSASGFQAAVAGATSFEDLYDVLLSYAHVNYGGGKDATQNRTAGFAFGFAFEGTPYRVGTRDPWRGRHPTIRIADKAIFREWGLGGEIETFFASIQAGVAEGLLAQVNGPAAQAVQQKVAELREQEQRGLVAFEERFDAPGLAGGAVSRLTVLQASRIGDFEGRDLLVSADQLALAGFDDDMIEVFIRRMAKVDRDRHLGAIDAEHLIF